MPCIFCRIFCCRASTLANVVIFLTAGAFLSLSNDMRLAGALLSPWLSCCPRRLCWTGSGDLAELLARFISLDSGDLLYFFACSLKASWLCRLFLLSAPCDRDFLRALFGLSFCR